MYLWRAQLEKTMTQLENRLDKASKRLNTRQAETRALRDNIDGLRKERLALNEALAKLDGQLSSQRQDATRLLRISQSECMGRDKVLPPCQPEGGSRLLSATADDVSAEREANYPCLSGSALHKGKVLFSGFPVQAP